jgi:hypothetical protein
MPEERKGCSPWLAHFLLIGLLFVVMQVCTGGRPDDRWDNLRFP